MPHLQGPDKKGSSKDGEEQPQSNSSTGEQSGNGSATGGSKLLSLAATATKHAPTFQPAKAPEPPQYSNPAEEDPSAATMSNPDHSQVTPSPYGTAAPHRGFKQQQQQQQPPHPPPYYGYEGHPQAWMTGNPMYDRRVMGGYGEGVRRLFPSPIRYARTKSEEEETDDSKRPEERSPPRNSGYPFRGPPPAVSRAPFYGPPGVHPYPGYHHRPYSYDDQYAHAKAGERAPISPIKKRPAPAADHSAKRWKPAEQDCSKDEAKQSSDESESPQSPASTEGRVVGASKQRVISPSSSIEANGTGKSQDDESASGSNDRSSKHESHGERPTTQELPARFPPQDPSGRYGAPPGAYQSPYYPPGPPAMYGYPPHFGESPHGSGWRMPPSGSFPPQPHGAPHQYPPSYPAYSRPPMPQQHQQQQHRYPPPPIMPQQHQHVKKAGDVSKASPVSSKNNSPERPGASKIKSVAEWQRATLATGKAPSANRCMPLKAPIPSKYWGEAEKTKDCAIPDFHQLVNFPDYLNKVKPNGSETPGSTCSGKRPCVMCGKHRVCSASTANLGGNVLRRPKKSGEDDDDDEDGDSHIIPRQNKGLCTACDVTVWVYVESGLEIKWCKGCKNFRPWAAFGDKGLATKCVRCRDRQREKYALQKDELRLRRLRQNSNKEEKRGGGHHEIAAAKGLRDLMAASASI